MQGLELSRRFFEEYGAEAIKKAAPEYYGRLAAGLFGQGSECGGFDDEISRDHDFSCGFVVLVPSDVYEKCGFRLERAYSALIKEHSAGASESSAYGGSRRGVFETTEYFASLTGVYGVPQSEDEWLSVPLYALNEAVNGELFYDGDGLATEIRNGLESMPDEIRLKRLSAALARAAQSGQYNFARCLNHGERAAARVALAEYAGDALDALFLLNRRYRPYYKWMFRAAKDLETGSEIALRLEALVTCPDDGECIKLAEETAAEIADILREKGLTTVHDSYLEAHAFEILSRLKSSYLRNLHIMTG